jgi:ABC-2 type transport system permease protein
MSTDGGSRQGPELVEIRGPSAFGGGWRRFLHLLWLNSMADLKQKYVGSVLGYLWTLIRPLFMFAILYFVFTKIFRIGDNVENYETFLIFNIVMYEYFAEATTAAVRSVVDHENVVRKMQFPRIVIPLAVVLTATITLCFDLIAAVIVLLILGVDPISTWLLLPLLLVPLVAFTTGVALVLSSLYVTFRDLEHIWGVAARALLYGMPVLYPVIFLNNEGVPQVLRWLVLANPLTPLFVQAGHWTADPGLPNAAEAVDTALGLWVPLTLLAVITAFGLWLFDRRAPRVAEAL